MRVFQIDAKRTFIDISDRIRYMLKYDYKKGLSFFSML